MEAVKPTRVAIVGGGLVGSLSACLFAKRGYQVELYEYRQDIRLSGFLSRGRTINLSLSVRGRRALRLAAHALESRVLRAAMPLRGRMLHLPGGELSAAPYDPHNNQCIYSVDRKYLNELLLNETETYSNVTTYFGHKLIHANLESGVLKFQRTETDDIVEKHTDVIVGADGAFSTVRRHMMNRPLFDYSHQYIEHGYLELAIPPRADGRFAMAEQYLHLWPRGDCLMIAMPNQDRSWTVTLFLPFRVFDDITSRHQLIPFFKEHFADAIPLIGEKKLVDDFFKTKPSPLMSVKCRPYHISDRAVILGDAAHAMVPFYGQGMNAGFEDCELLDTFLSSSSSLGDALQRYSDTRWIDAHAMCDLALYNFSELRSHVVNRSWALRRRLDIVLHGALGSRWQPLYQAVCFSDAPYSICVQQRRTQDKATRSGVRSPFFPTSCFFACKLGCVNGLKIVNGAVTLFTSLAVISVLSAVVNALLVGYSI